MHLAGTLSLTLYLQNLGLGVELFSQGKLSTSGQVTLLYLLPAERQKQPAALLPLITWEGGVASMGGPATRDIAVGGVREGLAQDGMEPGATLLP